MDLEVIIPAYNCKNTLKRTLDSLVAQTNSDFTVLLVDDCSTQDICAIVNSYVDRLSIRYVRNSKNVGCGMTRQRGMDETKADYITFLDADDILLPNAIATWLQEIQRTEPEVIYSPFFFVTKDRITVRQDGFFMCHGKVYNVDFLRKYDICESQQVLCIDDAYLNWQAFDLAQSIVLMREPTHLQIDTSGSITHSIKFLRNVFFDSLRAQRLACEKISRFKENPLKNFYVISSRVRAMLKEEESNHKLLMDQIWNGMFRNTNNPN